MGGAGGRERIIQTEASVEDEQIKCMKDNEMEFWNCWREEEGLCQGKKNGMDESPQKEID